MSTTNADVVRLEQRLRRLYRSNASVVLQRLRDRLERGAPAVARQETWNESDVVLITYGDQISRDGEAPLKTFQLFLERWNLPKLTNTVHFLPFFPYSSDDGFSVIDYRKIDPQLGDWEDVHRIGEQCKLMFDFVVNHVSQESQWFQAYLAGHPPYDKFFIESDPAADLSKVTRPRSLPLLSEFETSRGTQWLWTTFSRDQLDLDFSNPEVLAEVSEILIEYADHGARIIRLDAIAYLWKQVGSSCIHLPETHEVVKVLRDVLRIVAPQVLILTETNVPHEENVSYFGDGDEAHMVYQFSLPPLILDAFLNEDAVPLKRWLANLERPPDGATYFNFTASHDGVGVRPLEGHVDGARLATLVEKIKQRGGLIGTRRQSDGTDTPYELNISYVDALTGDGDRDQHARRFLASQSLMLALQGVPAIYFHSLVGSQNDVAGAEQSGIPRRINRRKFELDELTQRLESEDSLANQVFSGMRHALAVRVCQPAFHPDAEQRYVESNSPNVLCFERHCSKSAQRILIAIHFGESPETIQIPREYAESVDLLAPEPEVSIDSCQLVLNPAQIVWLEKRS